MAWLGHELVDLDGPGRTEKRAEAAVGLAVLAGQLRRIQREVDVVDGAVVHAQTAARVAAEFRMELEGVRFFDGVLDGGPQLGGVVGVLGWLERRRGDEIGLAVLILRLRSTISLPKASASAKSISSGMPGGGIGFGVPGQKAIAVPVVPADDHQPSALHLLDDAVEEHLGDGAVRAEGEGVLAAHGPHLVDELADVERLPAEDRRPDADEVVLVQLLGVGVTQFQEVAVAGGRDHPRLHALGDLLGVPCLAVVDDAHFISRSGPFVGVRQA